MTRELAGFVWQRAKERCEYCRVPAQFYPAPFQIDHIIARQHRGETEPANLAPSCLHCNTRKGPNIAGIDKVTGLLTPLYHPRNDPWAEHFHWKDAEIVGRTAIGRVTVQVLAINEPGFWESARHSATRVFGNEVVAGSLTIILVPPARGGTVRRRSSSTNVRFVRRLPATRIVRAKRREALAIRGRMVVGRLAGKPQARGGSLRLAF